MAHLFVSALSCPALSCTAACSVMFCATSTLCRCAVLLCSWAFPCWAAVLVILTLRPLFVKWWKVLHDSVRDEKFLVGRQLVNAEVHHIDEPVVPVLNDAGAPAAVMAATVTGTPLTAAAAATDEHVPAETASIAVFGADANELQGGSNAVAHASPVPPPLPESPRRSSTPHHASPADAAAAFNAPTPPAPPQQQNLFQFLKAQHGFTPTGSVRLPLTLQAKMGSANTSPARPSPAAAAAADLLRGSASGQPNQ